MNTPFYIEDYPDLVEDYRDKIPGGGKTVGWPFFENPLNNYVGVAIHHTAGPKTQDIDDIAWYHINVRGWASVGYHFLIKEGKAYYVGDLGIGRAHVADLNDKYIGVCVVGNYQTEEPDDADLRVAHLLCQEFIENEPDRFPNVDSWDNVKPHRELGSTACPGNTFTQWWDKIIKGVDDSSEWKEKLEKCEKEKEHQGKEKERYKKERDECKDELKKKDKQLATAIELAEKFEEKYNVETINHRATINSKKELEEKAIPALEDKINALELKIEALESNKYTVLEAVQILFNSLRRK